MNRALSVVLVTILAAPLAAQVRRLTAGGLRPLNEAVERLAERHGWRICYEETVPVFAGDARQGEPKPGIIEVDYDPAEGAGSVLRRVVADHSRRGGFGRFGVSREAGRWIVSVTEIRGKNGEWVRARSPLEYPVTISKGTWALGLLLEEMGRQISLHAGFKMHMTPGLASNALMQNSAAISASREPARTVVASMLRVSRHFSVPVAGMDTDWQVICAKSYGCAFQMVRSRPRKFLTPAPRDALQDIGPWNLRGRR
jgi:hypothetical protein